MTLVRFIAVWRRKQRAITTLPAASRLEVTILSELPELEWLRSHTIGEKRRKKHRHEHIQGSKLLDQ